MEKHIPHYRFVTIFLTLLALSTNSYSQDSYQVEYNLEFSQNKATIGKDKIIGLSAEAFFDEVNTNSHPYAEAAFLEQASSIAAAYVDSKSSLSTFDTDGTGTGLFLNYVAPNSSLIFQAVYGVTSLDLKNGINGTIDSDTIGIGIGTYIDNHSAINISYLQRDDDFDISFSMPATAKTTWIDINYKQVKKLTEDTALNLKASIRSSKYEIDTVNETNTIIGLSGDYYFNQSTSIGGFINVNSGDDKDEEGKTLGLNVSIFLTQTLAVYAEFSQFSANNSSEDDWDTTMVGATARF